MSAPRRHRRAQPPAAFLYLLAGGASYLVDVGVLLLLREVVGSALWLATSVGYWTSVMVNYALNKVVVFAGGTTAPRAWLRYGVLLVVNFVITLIAVPGLHHVGLPLVVAKTSVVAALAVLNFVVYRRWVFA